MDYTVLYSMHSGGKTTKKLNRYLGDEQFSYEAVVSTLLTPF